MRQANSGSSTVTRPEMATPVPTPEKCRPRRPGRPVARSVPATRSLPMTSTPALANPPTRRKAAQTGIEVVSPIAAVVTMLARRQKRNGASLGQAAGIAATARAPAR